MRYAVKTLSTATLKAIHEDARERRATTILASAGIENIETQRTRKILDEVGLELLKRAKIRSET